MQKTPYHSYKLNSLPKGCEYCVKGSKLVLFVTGLCPRSCIYCPISDKKYKKDVTYADEWPVKSISEIIEEARLIGAEGAGFTGGDPLSKLDRTLLLIKNLKRTFGEKFHVHLYTSFDLVKESTIKQLFDAGLDEIRFHPDLDDNKLWQKIELVKKYAWDIGIEIPVIPGKEAQTKKMIDFFANKVKFINLNELEIADNKASKLSEQGFKAKNGLSYAIKGSEELAKKLLTYIKSKYPKLNVHYCTATLKDKVQLANRIKRRAKNIAKPYDKITEDGTLVHGAVYLKGWQPSFGYKEKLSALTERKRSNQVRILKRIKNRLQKDFAIKKELIGVDQRKLRVLTSVKEIEKIRDDINKNLLSSVLKDKKLLKGKDLLLAIVEEYPTYDQIELNVEFL